MTTAQERLAPHVGQASVPWRDRKKYAWPLALVVPGLPFAAYAIWNATHSALAWWLTPVVLFGVLPLVDHLIGDDVENPPEELAAALQQVRYYRVITYLYVPAQYVGLVLSCWLWVRGGLGFFGAAGLVVTIGMVNGVSINTAHELGHKREQVERWLSKIALAPTCYGHFYVEHNRGHHVRVATPEDPASARFGEGLYAFLPRTVIGSLRSAWRLEADRLRLRSRRPWRIGNDVLNAWAMSVVLFAALTVWFGPTILLFLAPQAVVGFLLLEVVNYLEHYGLARQPTGTGRYEKVDPRHSWNSDRVIANLFLFQLQRHSDHHANPLRRYQVLRSFEVSPRLPASYPGMIVVALIPWWWRRVMDPLVVAHYGGDLSLANDG